MICDFDRLPFSPFDTAGIRANDYRLHKMTTEGEVSVLDYGSQYSQLIVRRVRELGFVSHLYAPERLGDLKRPGAIILSGGNVDAQVFAGVLSES